jgi:hypothetical protein
VPVSAAGKNNRRLIAARFGSSIVQKMKHTPSALRRSVLYEIEREFPEEHRRTAASRFRSMGDIAIANSLHHYYAFHTGRAVPGDIRYDYVDTSSPDVERRLLRILAAGAGHTFCINDTVSCDAETGRLIGRFLESCFPSPSPFEIAGTWADSPANRLNRPHQSAGSDEPEGAYEPARKASRAGRRNRRSQRIRRGREYREYRENKETGRTRKSGEAEPAAATR